MKDPKIVNETKVVFGPCRLSFTHVFNKYSPNGEGEGKYMTNVLIPKSEKKTIKALDQAIEAAKKAGVVSKWGGKEPKSLICPSVMEMTKRMMFIKTTSTSTRNAILARGLSIRIRTLS